jgi:hypothetical protein
MSIETIGGEKLVKALSPNGILRRKRYRQDDAAHLVEKGICIGRWSRKKDRLLVIQFLSANAQPDTTYRWLPTGTRYSFKARIGSGQVWQHRSLPHLVADAETSFTAMPEEIEAKVRGTFDAVVRECISTATRKTEAAPVVSITAFRAQKKKRAPVVPPLRAAA